jgi:DNA-binding NtrC family response regulator
MNSSPTLLLVDDDEGVAELQRRRLSRAGYNVCVSRTEEQARCFIQSTQIDLLVVDYSLGGVRTGIEFYETLKADGCDLPVIVVTGYTPEIVARQALRAGIQDYVAKSDDYLDRLPIAVERVLRREDGHQPANCVQAAPLDM